MSFEKTFCSSPWFHMRINNSGSYEPCRWMKKDGNSRVNFDRNIGKISPLDYFQNHMSALRYDLLDGKKLDMCNDCHVMEQHKKPSGRQKQLLKVGVQENVFEKSLASSPMRPAFDYSYLNQGHTTGSVTDWQIDLGNYCNGACVFCNPESSSTLAVELKKVGLLDHLPARSWCDDPELVDKFIQDLINSPELRYLHFIGGETLITPGFHKILSALVDAKLTQQITIGFTTNLTVWSDSVIDLLKQFQQINLGMSIESMTPINDYVRYPSKQQQTKKNLDAWVSLAQQQSWLMQLRTTPTCLTVHDLHTTYDYAWQNNIAVESCNFLDKPEFFRIGVLPRRHRDQVIKSLQQWIDQHPAYNNMQIINTRDPNVARTQLIQDAQSYVNYLTNASDESYRLPDLVNYLKRLESNRGNNILHYLPQYEDLFRSAGY